MLEYICRDYLKTEKNLKERYEYLKTIWNLDMMKLEAEIKEQQLQGDSDVII